MPLPNSILAHLTTHSATYLSIYRRIFGLRSTVNTFLITPVLNNIIYPGLIRLYNSPDILTLVLLACILLISLKILKMLWRTVLFWTRMFTQLAFWGSILLCGVYVWGRGWEASVEDVRVFGGEAVNFWTKEYNRFDAAQRDATVAANMDARGRGRGYKGR